MGYLCGVGVFGLIECSHSLPALHSALQIIIIIIKIIIICSSSLRNLAIPHAFFIPLSVSLWNDLADNVLDGVGLAGFKSRANVFLLA